MSDFVPYRKPGLETIAPASNSNKNGKKGKKTSVSSPTKPVNIQPSSNPDPFASILPSNKPEVTKLITEDDGTSKSMDLEKSSDAEKISAAPRKKDKFIPLMQAHGEELHIKLPERHPCQCMCTKHNLIINCLNCGRIVCEQEGSGTCFTCGELVCSVEERSILERGGLEAEKLRRKLGGDEALTLDFSNILKSPTDKNSNGFARAQAHKDKLLEFDRTAAQRTKIIDDQADYYNENVFMSPEQRAALKKIEEEKRKIRFQSQLEKGQKVTLDLAGRKLVSERNDEPDNMYAGPVDLPSETFSSRREVFVLHPDRFQSDQISRNLTEELSLIPNFPPQAFQLPTLRVQDRELQEMTDTGATLSVLQPWATFIVMGLKAHEGREWYTAHRGKLWITSGSKLLPPQDIIEEENLIKVLVNEEFVVFPEQYLTGFLLGSVDLVDCITQEEYQRRFPGGLLKYPYVLIFENPVELERKFPLDGKGKIFRMDPKIHQLAKIQPFKRPLKNYFPSNKSENFEIE